MEQRSYNRLLKATKLRIISDKVSACQGNTKDLYKIFNKITGKITINPMPEGNPDQLAEQFADFFMNKITHIRQSLEDIPKYKPPHHEVPHFNGFHCVSDAEIQQVIMSMSTTSCELDSMPTQLLKKVLPVVLPTITKIVNSSLETGLFVEQWKSAVIRPTIKKSGLEPILSNYRPVSNLSFLSKVLEKVALRQFMEHCNTNNLIPDYQSAYRKNFSCETALAKLVDDLLWAMERQQLTALMALDLSAAFDTVDHQILLDVLNSHYGVSESALRWLDSYLKPRTCKVNVEASYSSERDLTFSVPQGSCMGPVLYLTYAGTLQEVIPSGVTLYGYADDHAVKLSFPTVDGTEETTAIEELEQCALRIKSWMDENRLKMNTSKTEFIMFGSKRKLTKCNTNSLKVSSETVHRSHSIKYLGVTIDEALNFKDHIKNKCKVAMWNIQRVKQIRSVLTKDACETLVLGLVISQLDYANVVFSGLPDCDIEKLQRVQNISAKLVLNDGDSSYNSLKRLHWLPIRLRIKHKVLTLIYKCLKGQAPKYLQDLVKKDQTRRTGLRSATNVLPLHVPFTRRKTFASRSFSVIGPQWWNTLPNYIKTAENEDIFKKFLKTFLYTEF